MEIFYIVMFAVGVGYALIVTKPRNGEDTSSLSVRYPILTVAAFFGLMASIYYILVMADKNVMSSYYGFIIMVISFCVTSWIYRWLTSRKKK